MTKCRPFRSNNNREQRAINAIEVRCSHDDFWYVCVHWYVCVSNEIFPFIWFDLHAIIDNFVNCFIMQIFECWFIGFFKTIKCHFWKIWIVFEPVMRANQPFRNRFIFSSINIYIKLNFHDEILKSIVDRVDFVVKLLNQKIVRFYGHFIDYNVVCITSFP